MNKFIALILLISSTSLFAKDSANVLYKDLADRKFVARESHWTMNFGFEGMKYDLPFEFRGREKGFSQGKKELWGGRLGFGREFYIGNGFQTTTKAEGYFMGTLFSRALNGGPEESSSEFEQTKRTGQVMGIDISQNIGHIFEMKTKGPLGDMNRMTIEPFLEGGFGFARAFNKLNYYHRLTPTYEAYKRSVDDQLTNFRYGIGVNITSSEGFFLFLKATQNHYNITDRKIKTYRQPQGETGNSTTESLSNVNISPILIYALGGGYKF